MLIQTKTNNYKMNFDNNINIAGTLLNSLDRGQCHNSAIKELTDNSIGAGAKNIYMNLDIQNIILYVSDDGCGMNKSEMREMTRINNRNRKAVDTVKQGKFGNGLKDALMYLTQCKGKATIVSRSNNYDKEDEPLSQIVIDFEKSIKNDTYNPQPENAGTHVTNIWKKYSINENSTGTVFTPFNISNAE